MYNIKYSNQAKLDLEDTISYIAKKSKVNALNYLARYEEKIKLLSLNPLMGTECKNKLIEYDCRVLVYESYMIIYQVDKNDIFIVRIFHASLDYANWFSKEQNELPHSKRRGSALRRFVMKV